MTNESRRGKWHLPGSPEIPQIYNPNLTMQTRSRSNLNSDSDFNTAPMLKVSNLNVFYGESHILRNVDLETEGFPIAPGAVPLSF